MRGWYDPAVQNGALSDEVAAKHIAAIQKILKVLPTTKREIDENGKVRIKFRIDDVSKNHMVSFGVVQSEFKMLFWHAAIHFHDVCCCMFAEAALPPPDHPARTRAVAE